jgi:hypothetical protein
MQWFEMAGLTVMMVVLLGSVLAITMRWFRHRERLAMIREGLVPQDAVPGPGTPRKRRGLLLGGLSIALLGLLLLCAAFFVAVPSLTTTSGPTTISGLSSLGLIPLPGLLVAFMGVGLLILYVWAQPTVERRKRAAAAAGAPGVDAAPVVQDAELEAYEPEVEQVVQDARASTLDAKVSSDHP